MGGAQAGELASRIAAAALEERAPGLQGEETVVAVVQDANERIFQRSLHDPATAGMGTTVTVALVDEEAGTITIGHVGDRGRTASVTGASSSSPTTIRSSRSSFGRVGSRRRRRISTRIGR